MVYVLLRCFQINCTNQGDVQEADTQAVADPSGLSSQLWWRRRTVDVGLELISRDDDDDDDDDDDVALME